VLRTPISAATKEKNDEIINAKGFKGMNHLFKKIIQLRLSVEKDP